jgi:predicted DNA-binding transcriptional regulator YafY
MCGLWVLPFEMKHRRNMAVLWRLSQVSKLIRTKKMKARQIAEEVEVPIRSVMRDIKCLRDDLGHEIGWDDQGYFYRKEPPIVLGL